MPLHGDDDDDDDDDDVDDGYDDDDEDGEGGQLVVNQICPVQRVPIKCLWATKKVLAVTFVFIINIIPILSSSTLSTSSSFHHQHKLYFT